MLLDLGGQAQQAHELGDAGPGDSLAAGDLGLIVNLAGFEEGLPLKGLAEKLDDTWRSRRLGRLAVPVPGRNRTDDVFGGHAPRQDANVVVFEGPLRAQCDLDGLFVVGGQVGAVRPAAATVDCGQNESFAASPNQRHAMIVQIVLQAGPPDVAPGCSLRYRIV